MYVHVHVAYAKHGARWGQAITQLWSDVATDYILRLDSLLTPSPKSSISHSQAQLPQNNTRPGITIVEYTPPQMQGIRTTTRCKEIRSLIVLSLVKKSMQREYFFTHE
jgi:hypothetical protein